MCDVTTNPPPCGDLMLRACQQQALPCRCFFTQTLALACMYVLLQ
jgi:hypothetical protein